jgi:hypothetical protein
MGVDEVDEVGGREQRRVGAGVQRAANLVEGGVRRRDRWHRIVSLRRHEGWQAGDGAAVSGDVVGRQSGRGRACWGCATFGGEEAGRRIWGGSTGDGGQRSQGGMWDVGCGWDVGVAPGPAFEGTRSARWRQHSKSGRAAAAVVAARRRASGQLRSSWRAAGAAGASRRRGEREPKAGKRSA